MTGWEAAWLRTERAKVNDHVNFVVNALTDAPRDSVHETMEATGAGLMARLDALTREELTRVAHLAVTDLAQQRITGHPSIVKA